MYVAYVPLLDVSSCGRTSAEAQKNIAEAVELFLEEARSMGTLEQILQESGFIPGKNKGWKSPRILNRKLELSV